MHCESDSLLTDSPDKTESHLITIVIGWDSDFGYPIFLFYGYFVSFVSSPNYYVCNNGAIAIATAEII